MRKTRTRGAAIAAGVLSLAAIGCAEERGPLSDRDGTYQWHQNYVAVYHESDPIGTPGYECCEPPIRLDLELSGENAVDEVTAWHHCNSMGGTLVKYSEDTWVYKAGKLYCEDVDY